MHAYWCLGLGLGPLVGRTMVYVKVYVVRKPWFQEVWGQLDRWGCVLALLFLWSEASQHWSLQSVGCDWVLVLIIQARYLP